MVTVTIKNPDGSVYWVETFNDLESAKAWIKEEKTRPYWNKDYVVEIDDKTPTAEEIAAKKAADEAEHTAKKNKRKQILNKVKATLNLTNDEMDELFGG